MVGIIRAIMLACVVQILAGGVFSTFMLDRANIVSQTYTDNALRLQYNVLQVERSQEREDLHTWIDRRIELRLSQLPKERKQ